MTSRTPEMRFLGLPGEVDEPTLLGLEQDLPSTALEIAEALERRLELLEGLSRGERAVLEGRTYSQSEAREKMSKWLR